MLIGLTGKKQSGKDTAAGFLVEKGWVKIGFADPLRWCLAELDPLVWRDNAGAEAARYHDLTVGDYDRAKEKYPEIRRLLQVFGTEVGRNILGKYLGNPWLQIASIRIQQALLEGKHVVLSDVRFDDEAELIHKLGGKVLQVFRDATYQSDDQHVSEQGVSDHLLDHTIINNDSPGHLRQYVLRLVAGLEREAMEQTEYDPKDVAFGSNREEIAVRHTYTFTNPEVVSVVKRAGRTEYYLKTDGPVAITGYPVYAEEAPEAENLALNEEKPSLIERVANNVALNTFNDGTGMVDLGTILQIGEIIMAVIERCRQTTPDNTLSAKIRRPGILERLVVRRECVKTLGRAQFRQYGSDLVESLIHEGETATEDEIAQLLDEIP